MSEPKFRTDTMNVYESHTLDPTGETRCHRSNPSTIVCIDISVLLIYCDVMSRPECRGLYEYPRPLRVSGRDNQWNKVVRRKKGERSGDE